MRRGIVSAAALMLVFIVTTAAHGEGQTRASASTSQQAMSASERMLADRIYVRLAERAWAGADFTVSVDRGVATVGGTVPTEQTKQKIVRVVRRTRGVLEVRDQLRVNPAVGELRGGSPVPDAELSKRVAKKIAGTLTGAKAAEDWWFTGWRVEGPDRNWTMVVEAEDGAVTLEGEVPYQSTIRKAVDAALDVQGVRSVRSEIEIEPTYYGYPSYFPYMGYPYAYADPDYLVYYDGAPAHSFKGVQTLTGEVTRVDRQKGLLTLKTDTGSFDLSFPPSSLQGVNQGERISVQLGFREAGGGAGSPDMSEPRATK